MTAEFRGTVVAGSHDHSPAALLSTDAVPGLRLESTYFHALVRDADGQLYSAMRRLSSAGAWPSRLFTRSSAAAGLIDRHDLAVRTAPAAAVTASLGDGAALFVAPPTAGIEPFAASVSATSLQWDEGVALELSGADISRGLQWHLDGSAGAERYVSRLFEVHGTFDGIAVHGIAGVDQVFLEPGKVNYIDDPITAGHLSLAWCTWANRYDDGSAESGHVAFGPGAFAFAVRSTSDGHVHVGTRITGSVELDGGSPDRAHFDIDGEVWQYTADARGRCAPLGGPVVQSEGCLCRVGETRTPVVWSASMEVPA